MLVNLLAARLRRNADQFFFSICVSQLSCRVVVVYNKKKDLRGFFCMLVVVLVFFLLVDIWQSCCFNGLFKI